MLRVTGISIVVIALLVVQPFLPLQLIKPAYAHGLHSDTVMVANLNGRALTARIDIYDKNLMPLSSIDTNHIPDEARMRIRIYDANTDKNIPNVSLLLRIDYAGKMLVLDNFFTPDGEIWLSIKPNTTSQEVIISAPQETTGLPKYIGTLNNPAQLKGPLLVDGGLYEIKGEIWSIDSPQVLLDPTLKFTSYITVATIQSFNIGNGNVEVRSFYDKIIKFDYVQDKSTIAFSMPFNWDKKYVEQIPMLHMESVIDAPSLIADTYTATVNGIRLPNTAVITDKYTLAGKPIVHIMLPTSMLVNISDQLNSMGMGNSKVADFMIVPGEKDIGIPLKSENISTLSAMSSSMKYNINLILPPNDIMQGQPIQFGIMIMDAATMAMKDVKYRFVVLKDGQELIRRDSIAAGGSGNESVTFPTNVVGPVTIKLENIDGSNESVEFTVNVVPEFPLLVILPMILAFAGMIVLVRLKDTLYRYRLQ
mgnify:CR=1 FL=1